MIAKRLRKSGQKEARKGRKITVHDARRTCGSLLADLEVHPCVGMAILR